MARSCFVFCLIAAVLSICSAAAADSPTGIPQFSATIPIPNGFIDPLSGQVHVEIPIASVPQRNGPQLVAKYTYDSTYYWWRSPVYMNGPGWKLVWGNSNQVQPSFDQTYQSCSVVVPDFPIGNVYYYGNLGLRDVNGTFVQLVTPGFQLYYGVCSRSNGDTHIVSLTEISCVLCSGSPYSATIALDPSYYYLPRFKIWSSDGTALVNNYGGYTGTTNGNTGGQFTTNPLSFDADRCSSSPGAYHIYVTASDGTTQTYTLNCQTYSVSGYDGGGTFHTAHPVLPASLTLPDGTSYTFNYDTGTSGTHVGILTGITLPTGGQVSIPSIPSNWVGIPIEGYIPQQVTMNSGTWSFSYAITGSQVTTTVTAPPRYDAVSKTNVNDKTVYTSVSGSSPYRIQSVKSYGGSSTLLKTVAATYTAGYGNGCLSSLTTTLNDAGISAQTSYQYTVAGAYIVCSLPTQIQEYDFGASSPTRTTKISYLDSSVFKDRPASISIYAGGGTGSPVSKTNYTYDEYGANYCKAFNGSGVPMLANTTGAINHDDAGHGSSFWARGNVTSVSTLVSGTTYVTSHKCYDTVGNVTQEVDEAGNATNYDYTESWADTSCVAAGTVTRAFPTTVTDPMGLRTKTARYSCTGLTQAISGENDIAAGRVGTTSTYDWAKRPLCTNPADGGQTCNSYFSTAQPPYSTTTTLIASGPSVSMTTKTIVDGYGRTTQTQLTSDPEGTDYTDTTYDAFGRTSTVSNPYRSTGGDVTSYYYDALGRTTVVVEPDTSSTLTSYSGNTVTATDEAGNKRKTKSDAFGRVTSVWEDPSGMNYETDYFYDVLDNLVCVQQRGGVSTPSGTGCLYGQSGDSTSPWRIRRFSYDGLSRQASSTSPEAGTVSYTYYDNGLVKTRTAPAPNQTGTATLTTNYAYDADGRLTQKSYPGTSFPTVTFWYDGATPSGCTTAPPGLTDSNPKGSRTAMCDASGGTAWSHDVMGRVYQERRKIGASSGQYTTYTYNLDGSLYKINDPLGKTITYAPGGAGQPLSAIDGSSNKYVTSAMYSASGALTSMVNGKTTTFAGITVTNNYNKRLQPSVLSAATSASTVFSLSYGYGVANKNNGNISQIVNNLNNGRTQNFTYDSLNRIATASSQATSGGFCWGQVFGHYSGSTLVPGIDAWGNLFEISPSQCGSFSLSQSPTYKNQFLGLCYDAAGNLLDQGACPGGSHAFVYDPEGKLIWTQGYDYIYDGDGNRAIKCTSAGQTNTCPNGSTGTLYWRDAGGNTVVESDLAGTFQNEYVYFGGTRVSRRDAGNNIHYYYADHLTSARVVTNATGAVPPEQDLDFTPYGSIANGTPTERYLFTGQERDSESQLDYFMSRHYISALGRFMVPDPSGSASSDPASPQSWNLYSYVLNNPLRAFDPSGLDCVYVNPTSQTADFNVSHQSLDDRSGPPDMAMYTGSDGTLFGVRQGDCRSGTDNGFYFDGTVDGNSLVLNINGDVLGDVDGNTQCSGECPDLNRVNVNATDEGELSPNAVAILGTVYRQAKIIDSGPKWLGCTVTGGLVGVPPSFWTPTSHVMIEAAAKGLEHPSTSTLTARAYHTATDKRFKAFGKYSKVLVPRTAKALRPGLRIAGKAAGAAGLALLAYDTYEAGKACSAITF